MSVEFYTTYLSVTHLNPAEVAISFRDSDSLSLSPSFYSHFTCVTIYISFKNYLHVVTLLKQYCTLDGWFADSRVPHCFSKFPSGPAFVRFWEMGGKCSFTFNLTRKEAET